MYSSFRSIFNGGQQGDKFEGFKIKYRVLDPQNGTGNFIVEAESPQKIWEHTAPWIKGFGVKVEIRVMMTDEEFLETAKKLELDKVQTYRNQS